MSEFWAEILVEFLPTGKGGREQAVDLSNDTPGLYRPHVRVCGGSGEMLGVAFMDGPDDAVEPGASTYATIKSLYEPGVSYDELIEGAEFEILEGSKVVGLGRVVRR
jgi:hypothetical protein